MSAAQGRDRRRPGAHAHLVLLRGGLDHRGPEDGSPCTGPEDADWRSFCERIGWRHVEADLPDDYEDRLLARISRRGPLSGPLDFDDGAPASCSLRAPHDRRPRRDPADAAALAFAAALAVAACVMLWRAYRPPVSAVACPDVEASPRANPTPVVDSKDPTEPIDRRRDPAPRPRRPGPRTPPPGPSPSDARPERPTDPGSRLARRDPPPTLPTLYDDAPLRGSWRPGSGFRVSLGNPVGVPKTPPVSLANAAAMGNPSSDAREIGGPIAPPEGIILASAAPAIPRVPSAEGWTRPVSLTRMDAPALGTWSLSPSSPRWYGVGLPSAAPAGVPSGLGVMAQLDVGKALDGL